MYLRYIITIMIRFDDLDGYMHHKAKLFQQFGVWMRKTDTPQVGDKPKELREVLYHFTHEHIPNQTNEQLQKLIKEFELNMSIEFEASVIETTPHNLCVCSCNLCTILYNITHLKTLQEFIVTKKK